MPINMDELKKSLPIDEVQIVIGKQTVTAVLIGASFMTNQLLFEAQMPARQPRKPKPEAAKPEAAKATSGKR